MAASLSFPRQLARSLESVQAHLASTRIVSSLEGLAAGTPTIGTHDGTFHADEVMGVALLRTLPKWQDAVVLRTRKPELLAQANIVIDVGAEYDISQPDKQIKLDHHQASFKETYSPKHTLTKLSSAGLVYKTFGQELLRGLLGPELSESDLSKVQAKVYDRLMTEMDAVDNGVETVAATAAAASAAAPAFKITYRISTGLSSRVGSMNPRWNEDQSPETTNDRFRQALSVAYADFHRELESWALNWLPARSIVEKAVVEARAVHPSGQILVLDHFCPWKGHLFDLLEESQAEGESGAAGAGASFTMPLYVVFGGADSW